MTALSQFDVLCGRTSNSFRHPGNVRFREIVQRRRPEYRSENRRSAKNMITKQVIHSVTGHNGRFLRFDRKEGWQPLSDDDVYEKVSHALRGSVGSDKGSKAHAAKASAAATRVKAMSKKAVKPKAKLPPSEAVPPEVAEAIEKKSFREVAVTQQHIFQELLKKHQSDGSAGKPRGQQETRTTTRTQTATAAPDKNRRRRSQLRPASLTLSSQIPHAASVPSSQELDLMAGYDSSADESIRETFAY